MPAASHLLITADSHVNLMHHVLCCAASMCRRPNVCIDVCCVIHCQLLPRLILGPTFHSRRVWLRAGNNAVEMETTATFDKQADEFIINTPTTVAQKYWITNSAVHAKWSAVFAQLLIDGTNHGIHGFLVRIRNEVCHCFPSLACISTFSSF